MKSSRSRGFVVKRKRFAAEQIAVILKQAELGTPALKLCRQRSVTEQSFLPPE